MTVTSPAPSRALGPTRLCLLDHLKARGDVGRGPHAPEGDGGVRVARGRLQNRDGRPQDPRRGHESILIEFALRLCLNKFSQINSNLQFVSNFKISFNLITKLFAEE